MGNFSESLQRKALTMYYKTGYEHQKLDNGSLHGSSSKKNELLLSKLSDLAPCGFQAVL